MVVALVPLAIVEAAPAPAETKATGSFEGVTCPTATSCFAVGSYGDTKHRFVQPLVGRWNGSTWKLTAPPTPSAPADKSRGLLRGVACPASGRCFAVGSYDVGGGTRTLIEQWNGTRWAIAARPRPAKSTTSVLNAIACASPKLCFAVGTWNAERVTNVLIAKWNGSTWSIVSAPHIPGYVRESRLLGISCARGTCFAVGSYLETRTTKALTLQWNGTRWRWVGTRLPPKPVNYTVLVTVSCLTGAACHALGSASTGAAGYGGEGTTNPLAMRWNNIRWVIEPSPKPPPTPPRTPQPYTLRGVACPASNACVAVGSQLDNVTFTKTHAIVERWNGAKWTVTPTGLTSTPTLNAITCRSRTSCVAVGGSTTPVVARMSGNTWSATTVPVSLVSG